MSELLNHLRSINSQEYSTKQEYVEDIKISLEQAGYELVETNGSKPWGAYFRTIGNQADKFIQEFFPGLTLKEAQLGVEGAELSPKILLVEPNQRLSWQYHDRRAERWTFLTEGAYEKSETDQEPSPISASPGEVVQFQKGERHRLIGAAAYTVVAEIWQHSDPEYLSDENDIVRLADDYQR